MRREKHPSSAWLSIFTLLLGACVPLRSDYAVFQKSTVMAIDRKALKSAHVDLPPNLSAELSPATAVYLKALNGPRAGRKMALSAVLPSRDGDRWGRARAAAGDELLDDPADLLAAVLVQDLSHAGLSSAQSATCLGLTACPSAEMVLGVKVNDVHLALLPDTASLKLVAFEGEAAVRTRDGREVWRGSCMVENLSDTNVAGQDPAPRLQALLDRSTQKCAQLLGAELRAALQSEPAQTP